MTKSTLAYSLLDFGLFDHSAKIFTEDSYYHENLWQEFRLQKIPLRHIPTRLLISPPVKPQQENWTELAQRFLTQRRHTSMLRGRNIWRLGCHTDWANLLETQHASPQVQSLFNHPHSLLVLDIASPDSLVHALLKTGKMVVVYQAYRTPNEQPGAQEFIFLHPRAR